jgi:hypothetical protein
MEELVVSMPDPRPLDVQTFADFANSAPLKDWTFSKASIQPDGTVKGSLSNPAKGIGRFDAPQGFMEASYNIDFSFDPNLRKIADATLTVTSQTTGKTASFEGPEAQSLMQGILRRCTHYLQGEENVFRTMPDAIRKALGLPEYRGGIGAIAANIGAGLKWLIGR